METDIARYPTRKMTVHYDDFPNRSNLLHVKTMNTNDRSSTEIQLLPDEARTMVDELTKFLALAAQNDPIRYGGYALTTGVDDDAPPVPQFDGVVKRALVKRALV